MPYLGLRTEHPDNPDRARFFDLMISFIVVAILADQQSYAALNSFCVVVMIHKEVNKSARERADSARLRRTFTNADARPA